MPEITDLYDMEFEDPELEPVILPLDARLSVRGTAEEFRALFERLSAVAPQKETIPGTSFIYAVAEDDRVRFTASDGAQSLVLDSSKLRINREGRALLPAHKLKKIFSLAPEAHVTMTILSNTATISSGRAVWNIAIPAGETAPAVPDIDGIELFPVPRRAFYRALNSVKRALPSSGTRKSLEQVNIVAGSATAADGNRLIRQKIAGFPEQLKFAIPRATVDELIRSLTAGSEEFIKLGASSDLIVAQDGGETLVARQLALDFPDLEAQLVGPALENEHNVTLDTNELRELVKRVRVSADPEYAALTLHFVKQKAGDWELTVATRDRTGNSASESMFALWETDSAPFDVRVNHSYLSDLLEAYTGRLATLRLSAGTKTRAAPILLKDDDKGFTGVIQQSIAR